MLAELARLLVPWRSAFRRRATWVRVVSVLVGLVLATGRRTVTASIAASGRQHRPRSAWYLAFSRAAWRVADLFGAVLDAAVATIDMLCARANRWWWPSTRPASARPARR